MSRSTIYHEGSASSTSSAQETRHALGVVLDGVPGFRFPWGVEDLAQSLYSRRSQAYLAWLNRQPPGRLLYHLDRLLRRRHYRPPRGRRSKYPQRRVRPLFTAGHQRSQKKWH